MILTTYYPLPHPTILPPLPSCCEIRFPITFFFSFPLNYKVPKGEERKGEKAILILSSFPFTFPDLLKQN